VLEEVLEEVMELMRRFFGVVVGRVKPLVEFKFGAIPDWGWCTFYLADLSLEGSIICELSLQ
jgi:hypothetical protein